MTDMLKLTDSQQSALISLGRFKFLNAFQLSRITGYIPNSINRSLKALPEWLIDYFDFGVVPWVGKIPRLYFLKEAGVEVLENMGVRHRKRPLGRVILAPNTYAHRTGIIDVHIALALYLDAQAVEMNFFEADFEVTGANRGGREKRYPVTKIHVTSDDEDYIIPDFACSYFHKDNTPFFLWEYHRGEDSGRFIRQLAQHTRAIKNGSSTEKYKELVGERNPRILCVFEQPSTRNAVARGVLEDVRFQDMHEFFLFASLDDVRGDISTAFKHLSDTPFSFLPENRAKSNKGT